MRYTISEMAALLGVTTHTLRYYEKMGLIQPEVNRETGYRYYTVTDTRRFNLCRELRAAGTGPAGTGRPSKLPAVPGAGNAGRCPAAAGHGAAQLQQLPRAGRQLVPHRRAYRAGKR